MSLFYHIQTNGKVSVYMDCSNHSVFFGARNFCHLLQEVCIDRCGERQEPYLEYSRWVKIDPTTMKKYWPDVKKSGFTDFGLFEVRFLTCGVPFKIMVEGLTLPPNNEFFFQPECSLGEGERWMGVYGDVIVALQYSGRVVDFPREIFEKLKPHIREFFSSGRCACIGLESGKRYPTRDSIFRTEDLKRSDKVSDSSESLEASSASSRVKKQKNKRREEKQQK